MESHQREDLALDRHEKAIESLRGELTRVRFLHAQFIESNALAQKEDEIAPYIDF